jgi:hypothetical protein
VFVGLSANGPEDKLAPWGASPRHATRDQIRTGSSNRILYDVGQKRGEHNRREETEDCHLDFMWTGSKQGGPGQENEKWDNSGIDNGPHCEANKSQLVRYRHTSSIYTNKQEPARLLRKDTE